MTRHDPALTEVEIRSELLRSLSRSMSDHEHVLLQEVGLLHGSYRADVVLIHERMSGFEIKSAADSLDRLPHQVRAYGAIFDLATAVVTVNHLVRALEILPEWWGVTLATAKAGTTTLIELREPGQNPSPDPRALAALLWKSEADDLLASSPAHRGAASTRKAAYDTLAATHTWDELRALVSSALRLREDWLPAYSQETGGG